ncbi:MAG: hypothetical protein ONB44_24505 [candidate division KSB1 bacterium]|nr:hypothetical protein [candidate division KSB1 bacterium]MDZ7314409.1 hypothetical protein [candidate division KSB1 bacterium]
MVTEDSLSRFVRLLADWAAAPGDRQIIRRLRDPLHDPIWQRLRTIAASYYWDKFACRGGAFKEEFEEECIYRLFVWITRHPEEMRQGEFTFHNLEALVKRIAENHRNSIGRRLRRRWFHSLDEYGEELNDASPRRTPEKLQVSAQDPAAARYPGLEGEFLHAQRLIPEFVRSLAGKEKILELVCALRALGATLGKLHGFPADWWVFRVLKRRRREHLPSMVQKFLRVKFARLDSITLEGRVTCLRRVFRAFLARRSDFDLTNNSQAIFSSSRPQQSTAN